MNYKENNKNLNKRINIRSSILDKLFIELNKKISKLVFDSGITITKDFKFSDYPELEERVQKCLDDFFKKQKKLIVNSIDEEWENANKIQDKALKELLQSNIAKIQMNNNLDALESFKNRVTKGMNLSQRVWNITQETQSFIESSIAMGVQNGDSAYNLANKLNEFLFNPNNLHKSWIEAFGKDNEGIKDARYKAQRLMRTEVNMSYRTAENVRWNNEDFVLGFEVKLSKNHNCKGVPEGKFFDICDELQGEYPKSFKFVGWHPQCRCYAVPILPSTEEMAEYINNDMPDGYFDDKKIVDIPENFKNWFERNESRIERAKERGTLPYFIKDNIKILEGSKKLGFLGNKKGRNAKNEFFENIKDYKGITEYSEEQIKNFKEIEKELGIKRNNPMTFIEADGGRGNIDNFKTNCASCVYANELRRRGFNVTALDYYEDLSADTTIGLKNIKGNQPQVTIIKDNFIEKLSKQTNPEESRYFIGINYNEDAGHIVCAETINKKLIIFDPQKNSFLSLEELTKDIESLELIRIDRLNFNTKLLSKIVRKL